MSILLLAGCARFEDKPLSAVANVAQLEARSLSDTNFKVFLETNLQRQFTAWPLTNLDLPVLTLAAYYFHPGLDVARAQWSVARGGETTAGGRPNPILGVTPGYSGNPPRGVSPWFPSVTLDVPIETAGKRGYRRAHAGHLSEVARLNIATAAWQVRSAVRTALVEYAVAVRRTALLGENVALQQNVLVLLEQRLAAGAAGAAELAPSRIALVKARADAADAQRLAADARAKIADALGLTLHAIQGCQFVFDLQQATDAELLSAEARRSALLGRADILAGLAEYDASQSALQLEIAKQYPDLHFNPGYQFDQGENKWQLGLSVELPVMNRNQGPIAEARAKREEMAARFMALQTKVISEIERALLSRAGAVDQLRQLDELSAAHHQQLVQVQSAFRAGASDQIELATAHVESAAVELARLDALAHQQQAVGLLEDALQRPFGGWSTVERDPKLQATKEK